MKLLDPDGAERNMIDIAKASRGTKSSANLLGKGILKSKTSHNVLKKTRQLSFNLDDVKFRK
jgi:hypothetical protein